MSPRAYVAALSGVALVAVTLSTSLVVAALLTQPPPWTLDALMAALVGGVFVAHRRSLIFFWRGQRTSITFDEPAILLALYLLPPLAAVPLVAASQALVQVAARRQTMKAAYNVSAYSLAAACGGATTLLLRAAGVPALPAAMTGLAAYTLTSHALVSALFAIIERASVARTFRERFLRPTILHATLGIAGALALIGLWTVHPLATLAIVPFAYLAAGFLRLHGRVEREVEVHRRLAAMTTALAGEADLSRAATLVLDTCGDLFHAGKAMLELAPVAPGEDPLRWTREFEGGVDGDAPLSADLKGRGAKVLGRLTVHPGRRTRDRHKAAEGPTLDLVAGQAAAAIENAATLHAMRELKDLNEGIVANVPAGVVRLDAEGRVIHANAEIERLFGGRDGSVFEWAGLRANPLLGALVREVLDGQGFTEAEVENDDADAPACLSISAVPLLGEREEVLGAVILAHDSTARKSAEEARKTEAVTRPLVRRIISSLVDKQEVSRRAIARVGRDIARGIDGRNAHAHASAFRAMGLGSLAFRGIESGSYRFEADDLLERREGATQPTCHLALGFVEGAVANLTGAETALGTELRCQSMGHERCVFVAKPSAPRAAIAFPDHEPISPARRVVSLTEGR